jgi:hypothetical protein
VGHDIECVGFRVAPPERRTESAARTSWGRKRLLPGPRPGARGRPQEGSLQGRKEQAGRRGQRRQGRLHAVADRMFSGELVRADAAVVSQVLNVKLRALERERKWKELGELEDRLEALERVLKGRNAG